MFMNRTDKGPTLKVFMGKQVHAYRTYLDANQHGTRFLRVPKFGFIYDVVFSSEYSMDLEYNKDNFLSVGIPNFKEGIAKRTNISGGGTVRAELGPKAGYQGQDADLYAYWHFSGRGCVTSGPVRILVVYELSKEVQ